MFENFTYFKFEEVFDFERGQRFTKEEHLEGEIPYVSSTKENNGIDNYVNPPLKTKKGVDIIIHNNKIGLNNSGSVGYCFYHNYHFIASDHVTVIDIKEKYNQKLTLNIALFLKPIFERIKDRYSFGREISNSRLSKEMIFLPYLLKNNQKVPNWQFMEDYINKIGKNVEWNNKDIIDTRIENKKIDTSNWKEFVIKDDDIFGIKNINRGKDQIQEMDNFGIALISSTSKENGLIGFKDNPIKVFKKNSITLANNGSIGALFYQNEDFCATQDITILSNIFLNKYIALFLITILKKEKDKYSYGRKWNNENLKNTAIKLPLNSTRRTRLAIYGKLH